MLRKCTAAALALLLLLSVSVCAEEPYRNYTYSSSGKIYNEPQAYYAGDVILGSALGIGDFKGPEDVFAAPDGQIYIADTDNNRIVVLNADYTLARVIDRFQNDGQTDSFSAPAGIFVTEEQVLYVADSKNKRIVVLNADGTLRQLVGEPAFDVDEQFVYEPVRIAVDHAGRMFIVSKNVNFGMIELNRDGSFSSFFGAIEVKANIGDALWRRIATESQRAKMQQNVPTEYSSNAIDKDGFVYGTISTSSITLRVKKQNAQGTDVLRRNGATDPVGDMTDIDENNQVVASSLVDICVADDQVYSILDAYRGRIFTYDNDGNLMYVFGALGNRRGCLRQPSALDITADHTYLVADSGAGKIVCFYPTEYAQKINRAVKLQYERDYENARAQWMEMLKYSANNEMAFNQIGEAYYRQEAYAEALKYFKLAKNQRQYSKAFKELRREFMNRSFSGIMTGLVVLTVLLVGLSVWRRRKRKGREE